MKQSCIGFIYKDFNNILIIYNNKLKKWTFPGGKVEPGERFKDCVIREVYEEVGIKVGSYVGEETIIPIRGIKECGMDFDSHVFDIKVHALKLKLARIMEPDKSSGIRIDSIYSILSLPDLNPPSSNILRKYIKQIMNVSIAFMLGLGKAELPPIKRFISNEVNFGALKLFD